MNLSRATADTRKVIRSRKSSPIEERDQLQRGDTELRLLFIKDPGYMQQGVMRLTRLDALQTSLFKALGLSFPNPSTKAL
jgi:hypothetical protein